MEAELSQDLKKDQAEQEQGQQEALFGEVEELLLLHLQKNIIKKLIKKCIRMQ